MTRGGRDHGALLGRECFSEGRRGAPLPSSGTPGLGGLMGTLFGGVPLGRHCSWAPDVWQAERGDVALRDAPHVFELRRFAAEHW